MHGGELFAEIVIVAGLTAVGSWLIWMIATAQDMRRKDESAHGDVPHLLTEATTRGTGGGGPSISAGRRSTHTQQHIHPSSHDGETSQ